MAAFYPLFASFVNPASSANDLVEQDRGRRADVQRLDPAVAAAATRARRKCANPRTESLALGAEDEHHAARVVGLVVRRPAARPRRRSPSSPASLARAEEVGEVA